MSLVVGVVGGVVLGLVVINRCIPRRTRIRRQPTRQAPLAPISRPELAAATFSESACAGPSQIQVKANSISTLFLAICFMSI
jgi:hypothetical protein